MMTARSDGTSATDLKSRELKVQQSRKIVTIRQQLVAAGLLSLDQQAIALGLSRSTTWSVLKGNHKHSGLSAKVIARILNSAGLPQRVRTILIEYIQEKCAGHYGHNQKQIVQFRALLGEPADNVTQWFRALEGSKSEELMRSMTA